VNEFKEQANLLLQYHLIIKEMHKKILWLGLSLVLASSLKVKAQDAKQDSTYKKWFVGSSLLMLGNFSKISPEYVQLNFGYRITPKDVLSLDFKRSIYSFPLGLPFGPSFDKLGEELPRHARILAPTDTSVFCGKESLHPFMH